MTTGDPASFRTIDEALTSGNVPRHSPTPADTPATPVDTAGDSAGTAAGSAAPGAERSDHAVTEAPEGAQAGSEASSEPGDAGGLLDDWRPGQSRHWPWEEVRRRYTEGYKDPDHGFIVWPTLNEVGEHFGIPGPRVREKSSQQGWVEQRRTFQAQVEGARRSALAATRAKSAAELDGNALTAAQMGIQLCLAALGDLGRRIELHRQAYVGNPDAPPLPVSSLEQQRLAAAVELWHKIGLRAIGDPDITLQVTGAGGGPIEITQELRRDDPDRVGAVLAVLKLADLEGVIPGTVLAATGHDGDGRADGVPAAIEAHR
jgi:hypothetical protein